MATQGNWSGNYQGEWFGNSGGPGPDYRIAALVVEGIGTAVLSAEVIAPAPPNSGQSGGSGGHVGARVKLSKRKEFAEFFEQLTTAPLLTEADRKELEEEILVTAPTITAVAVATPKVTDEDDEIAAVLLLLF